MNANEKKTAKGISVINKVIDSMAKMDGININTLKLVGDPSQPINTVSNVFSSTIDYSKLPTEFLEMIANNRTAYV